MQPWLQPFLDTVGPAALEQITLSWAPRLLAAVLTIAGFLVVAFLLRRAMLAVFKRIDLDATAATFLQSAMQLTLIIVGTLTVLAQLGVDTTSLLTSLGVLGLTLGFAAQNTLSNVISGLFIFWDRPFVIGDLIDVDGEYGRVETITLRSTRLVTVDGRMIAIPNAVIADGKVASYTNFPNLRIDVDVTVGVNESIAQVRSILLGLVADDPDYMAEPAPAVVVSNLGDYNVTVVLRAWLRDETTHVHKRFALREHIKEALDEAGVEMPFETVALTPLSVRLHEHDVAAAK